MTREEFKDWIKCHIVAFPGLKDWLQKSPGTTDAWGEVFHDVDLSAAKQVTKDMLSGRVDTPRGWSDHPATVRRHARNLSSQRHERPVYIDGEETFGCHLCQDTGWVSIVHPAIVAAILQGDEVPDYRARPASIACQCNKAPSREKARYKDCWGRYIVDGKSVIVPTVDYPLDREDRVQAVREAIAAAGDYRRPNHVDSFDTWNQGAEV